MVLSDSIVANRGGARNVDTPLRRPCDKLLDVQGDRSELQQLLGGLTGLPAQVQWLVGVVEGLHSATGLLERQLQIALEAERAVLEGRSQP